MVLSVAYDVGPLVGPRTGIGSAVAALRDAIGSRAADSGVELIPYLLSFRATPEHGVRRLPLPAVLAHRVWAHADVPHSDRWLAPARVVHGTNYVVPPMRRAARLVSVYDCWFVRHPDEARPAVVRAGRVLDRSVRRGAVVHASSHATADAVREHWPGADVRVVHLAPLPLPPPPGTCPIAELDGRDFVLAVATLERRKNLPRLVQAFGRLAAAHPDLHLVLAGGDGEDRPAVDAAIDALGPDAGSRVVLTGFVDDTVRSWLLHRALVLAYPSLDEGFGFPLLDAMACDLPIVASTSGSIPEVAGDAALVVAADDVDALAGAIDRALTDDAERRRLVAAGHDQLARFSWAATAGHLVDLYRELSGGTS